MRKLYLAMACFVLLVIGGCWGIPALIYYISPFISNLLDYWVPSSNQIINATTTPQIEIHLESDIDITTFSPNGDLVVLNTTSGKTESEFWGNCYYYPVQSTTGSSPDCDVMTAGAVGSPKIVLDVDYPTDVTDGDVFEITLRVEENSVLTSPTLGPLNMSSTVRYVYKIPDGINPFLVDYIDLDTFHSAIYPYGNSVPSYDYYFPPHGKIKLKFSESLGFTNYLIEPGQPFDLASTCSFEAGGIMACDASSETGFEIGENYLVLFLSEDTPFMQLHPLLPPTQDSTGLPLVCGPDCDNSSLTDDKTGVEFKFRTSKVRIDNFVFQGYYLKIQPSQLPLSMAVGGAKTLDVADVNFAVSLVAGVPIPSGSAYADTATSFRGAQVQFMPRAADLGDPTDPVEIQLHAQSFNASGADTGFDYISYNYVPVPPDTGEGDHPFHGLKLSRIYEPPYDDTALICGNYYETENTKELRFYVHDERNYDPGTFYGNPENLRVYPDPYHTGCNFTARFTPNGPNEKLFAVAIVTDPDKTAYLSNAVDISSGMPVNLPGINFFADLTGDHIQDAADMSLISQFILGFITVSPNVLPPNGDSGAVSGDGGFGLPPNLTAMDISVFNDFMLGRDNLRYKSYGGYPSETPEFLVKGFIDNQTVNGRTIYSNIGAPVARVYFRLFDVGNANGVLPRSGLGINFIWTDAVTMSNVFNKEVPSGATFNPETDDLNGNGFQDCCYSSHNPSDMNCSMPATSCALAVTWSMGMINDPFGFAVGPDPTEFPLILNTATDGYLHNITLEAWLPGGGWWLVPDVTIPVSFSTKVPKPVITKVGTKDVIPEVTAHYNGVRQNIEGSFPDINIGDIIQSSVGDNRTVDINISSQMTDCYCNTTVILPVSKSSFTGNNVDFSLLCGIPASMMACTFDITATGHDSLGYPSLVSAPITIHIDPRDTNLPPTLTFPQNATYNVLTWGPVVTGEALAFTNVDIYDQPIGGSCVPSCSAFLPGSNCSEFYAGSAISDIGGLWYINHNTLDGGRKYYAISYNETGYCSVSDPIWFIKDTQPPKIEITSFPFVLSQPVTSPNPYSGYPYLLIDINNPDGYFIEGQIIETNLDQDSISGYLISTVEKGYPPSTVSYPINKDLCLPGSLPQSFKCRIPDTLEHTPTIDELEDNLYIIRINASDLAGNLTSAEFPLIISHEPIMALTINAVEQFKNGKIPARIARCTGTPIPSNNPPTSFDLLAPQKGFDIDIALSDLAIDFSTKGDMPLSYNPLGWELYHESDPPGQPIEVILNDENNTALTIPQGTDVFEAIRNSNKFNYPQTYINTVMDVYGIFIRFLGSKANRPQEPDYIPPNFPVLRFPIPAGSKYTKYTLRFKIPVSMKGYSYNYPPSDNVLSNDYGLSYSFYVGKPNEPDYGTYTDLLPFGIYNQDTQKVQSDPQTIYQCLTLDHGAAMERIREGVYHPDGPSYFPGFDPCMPPNYWLPYDYGAPPRKKTLSDYYYDTEDPRYETEIPDSYWALMDKKVISDVAAVVRNPADPPPGRSLRDIIMEEGLKFGVHHTREVLGQTVDGGPDPQEPESYYNINLVDNFFERAGIDPDPRKNKGADYPYFLNTMFPKDPVPPFFPPKIVKGKPSCASFGAGTPKTTVNNQMKDWGTIKEIPLWDGESRYGWLDKINDIRDYNYSTATWIGHKEFCDFRKFTWTENEQNFERIVLNIGYYNGVPPEVPLGQASYSGGDILDPGFNLDYLILTHSITDEQRKTYIDGRIYTFDNIVGHTGHEMGHRIIGVTGGLPPTGLFANTFIGNHSTMPDGTPDCAGIMAGGGCSGGRAQYKVPSYQPLDRAYLLHRMLINRKFNIYFPEVCDFFPDADQPYAVVTLQHRQGGDALLPLIVLPGVLKTDY